MSILDFIVSAALRLFVVTVKCVSNEELWVPLTYLVVTAAVSQRGSFLALSVPPVSECCCLSVQIHQPVSLAVD